MDDMVDNVIPDLSYERSITDLSEACYGAALERGEWNKNRELFEIFQPIHHKLEDAFGSVARGLFQPAGQNLADVLILILDYCGSLKLPIGKILVDQLNQQNTRGK